MKVAIAGAGISGLASALAIARKHDNSNVYVYERQAKIAVSGAGIQLGPNAFHALNQISPELAAEVKEQIITPSRLLMRDIATNKLLSSVPLGEQVQTDFGQPYGMLHRAVLQAKLLEHAQAQTNIEVQLGRAFDAESAFAKSADLTIAADGLWSTLREQVMGEARTYLSSIAFRAFAHCTDEVDEIRLWVGAGVHVVAYPVLHPTQGHRVLNIAAFVSGAQMLKLNESLPQQDNTSWAMNVSPQEMCDGLLVANDELKTILLDAQDCSAWRVFDLKPIHQWFYGKTVLVGDAAHAMLPHLAQGAAFGLEDAACLAKAPLFLAQFQENRLERCLRAQMAAKRYQAIYHAGGLLQKARNAVLSQSFFAPKYGGLSWVYSHQ
jgi:2-polyprenyl-6-methoxyphenol hydroxylase-like FAD-dependent oxidoreductase